MSRSPVIIAEGLSYLEGPRWRHGQLWASDFYTHRVLSFGTDGSVEVVATLDDQPSGLGWLPDGSLLVATMLQRKILRIDGTETSVYADLSKMASWHLNDLIVDERGNTYVGNFGFDLMHGADPLPANVICITADRKARVVAHDLNFPNGMAITPDGRTMIMAEFCAAADCFRHRRRRVTDKSTGVGVVWRGTHREGLQRNAGSSEHRTGRNFP